MDITVSSIVKLMQDLFHLDQLTSEAILSILFLISAVLIAWTVNSFFERYIKRWAQKTTSTLDDKIFNNVKAPIFLIAILIGAYYSLTILSILDGYRELLRHIFIVAEIFAIAFMLTRVFSVTLNWYGERRAKQDKAVSNHLLFVFNKILQIIIYIAAFLAVLWAFNIDLSNIVVGLGVGGIAIALAVQSTLSDILSAFSIYFDRPFEIGDFIVIGEYSGTVTKIGVKSTRLQLLQGEELVISNKELTSTSLRNFKKLQKRRIAFTIGVTYDTPPEKLKKIPTLIEQVITNTKLVEFSRAHFSEFGDFSLKFEIVYYVTTGEYDKYMDAQQEINLGILKAFEKEGITMAFPTQTLLIKNQEQQK